MLSIRSIVLIVMVTQSTEMVDGAFLSGSYIGHPHIQLCINNHNLAWYFANKIPTTRTDHSAMVVSLIVIQYVILS